MSSILVTSFSVAFRITVAFSIKISSRPDKTGLHIATGHGNKMQWQLMISANNTKNMSY